MKFHNLDVVEIKNAETGDILPSLSYYITHFLCDVQKKQFTHLIYYLYNSNDRNSHISNKARLQYTSA